MLLLLFYLCLALFISFLCSIMESVLLSTPMSFLLVKEKEGLKSSRVFIKLKNHIDRPLSAILSLNTIAHTIGAAGVGAEATKIFGEVYFGLISAVLTFLILIFSEIIPKTIGASYWRSLALTSGLIINFMVIISYPLVIMSGYITKLFSADLKDPSVSREEISVMADIGTEEGVFKERENKVIQNLIRLRSIKVTEIMTPRVVVVAADENMSLEEFLTKKEFRYYSRIPIYSENIENVRAYVFRQTVFEKLAEKKEKLRLKDISREIVITHEFQTLLKVWDQLLKKKEHIALVVDEYGGMDGIVTMEDIIETLLGIEILDEKDKIIDMQQYARERWAERKAKFDMLDKSNNSEISDNQ
ncbi:CBS domain containing-hemolysin-like protein [Ancylomarina subtilis]|uniref:CBS domain containing-hemolysin-like protein n=1 Tax=Ancylomarina subtilis TaxID=1639035 RepID=A0A4Q7VID6_9BACT|nr:CNNM domain-containing protein [Ancylomarina subtilis]RZT95892.1 CBS domain containing-hemolysin-like protein [Ancylomarina subtilis]